MYPVTGVLSSETDLDLPADAHKNLEMNFNSQAWLVRLNLLQKCFYLEAVEMIFHGATTYNGS